MGEGEGVVWVAAHFRVQEVEVVMGVASAEGEGGGGVVWAAAHFRVQEVEGEVWAYCTWNVIITSWKTRCKENTEWHGRKEKE